MPSRPLSPPPPPLARLIAPVALPPIHSRCFSALRLPTLCPQSHLISSSDLHPPGTVNSTLVPISPAARPLLLPRLSIFHLRLLPSSSTSPALLPTLTFEPSIITPSDALSRALPLNYSTLPTLLLSLPLSGRCHSFRRRATSSAAAYY